MRVWVLEWFCSDSNDYQFVDLFKDFSGIMKYLNTKGSPETGVEDFILEIEEGQIRIWKTAYYVPKASRTHYSMDNSNFVASRRKVK